MTRPSFLLALTISICASGCGFGDNRARTGPTHHSCGDGVTDSDEGCDDGNATSGDGCSPTCQVETSAPACGNGVREVGEACDDGNTSNGDGCSPACEVESVCGNGTRETGEACDDGNVASGDGCSPTCQVEMASACGLVPQTGCTGANPACDLADADLHTTACRPVTTNGSSDSLCTTPATCGIGFTCVEDGGAGSESSCMRFCTTNAQCGANSKCAYTLLDGDGASLNVKVCSNSCGILGQTGCPTGWGCLGVHDAGGDFSDCAVMGTTPDGGACTTPADCMPGSTCVGTSTSAVCRSYCNVNTANSCDAGSTCIDFAPPLTINGTTYGACH